MVTPRGVQLLPRNALALHRQELDAHYHSTHANDNASELPALVLLDLSKNEQACRYPIQHNKRLVDRDHLQLVIQFHSKIKGLELCISGEKDEQEQKNDGVPVGTEVAPLDNSVHHFQQQHARARN